MTDSQISTEISMQKIKTHYFKKVLGIQSNTRIWATDILVHSQWNPIENNVQCPTHPLNHRKMANLKERKFGLLLFFF